jgi:hypothetical protein
VASSYATLATSDILGDYESFVADFVPLIGSDSYTINLFFSRYLYTYWRCASIRSTDHRRHHYSDSCPKID